MMIGRCYLGAVECPSASSADVDARRRVRMAAVRFCRQADDYRGHHEYDGAEIPDAWLMMPRFSGDFGRPLFCRRPNAFTIPVWHWL